MKRKIINILVIAIFLLLVSCGEEKQSESILDSAIKEIQLEDEIINNIDFQTQLDYKGNTIAISYIIKDEYISSDGTIYPLLDEDVDVPIECILTLGAETKQYNLKTVKLLSMEQIVQKTIAKVSIPSIVSSNLDLPTQIGLVRLKWNSSNTNIISRTGELAYISNDEEIKLTCSFLIKTIDDDYQEEKEYIVTATQWDAKGRFEYALNQINIPQTTCGDIDLISEFDYDVHGLWTSSDNEVISKIGNVTRQNEDKKITLKLELTCDGSNEKKEVTYEVLVLKNIIVEGEMNFNRHILVNRARDIDVSQMTNLYFDEVDQRIRIKDGYKEGTIESPIYNTLDFYRIVGSFSCITNTKATCELAYSIKVDGKWSKYLSYGEYGLGRNNLYYDQTDTNAMIDTDMVIPLHNKVGTAFKYRITMRRTSTDVASPALSLIASTIFMNNYVYKVDTSELPNSVDWEVPKLNQNIVPTIGNVICSATTTTMLLKYAGYDFSDKGYQYEHEYMAAMVADKGHNNPTYGNWSYNMMTAGAFGINAYVGKYYTWDEIRYHLANYGPLGISISGNFGRYTTGGHLIVLRGYRIENGETTVICNDPNIAEVYYEVTLETFLRCMGSVVYIMEYGKEIINFK